jgi:DNA mismatch endonuclease (patch repair protein)
MAQLRTMAVEDVLNPEQRSYCMSRNRGSDTGPELILRKALWAQNLRYRLQSKLIGKPDIVYPGSRLAIFVDGCFWHGCPIHYQAPSNNSEKWRNKIAATRKRDEFVADQLQADGWAVIRFWEHSVKDNTNECVDLVKRQLEK